VEILAATLSEIHGPFFERIEIVDDATDSTVRVGDKAAGPDAELHQPRHGREA